jgi:hypothetical protein
MERSAAQVQKAGDAGNLKRGRRGRHRQACGFNDLGPNEIAGMGRFFIGYVVYDILHAWHT